MESSRTITLFAQSTDIGRGPTSFVFSILFHCVALSLVFFGFLYSPRLNTRVIAERYNLRKLDLDMPDLPLPTPAPSKVNSPLPKPQKHATPSTGRESALRQVLRAPQGPQTLLQPDLAKNLAIAQEVPVPTVMIWQPDSKVEQTIVAPRLMKPTSANVTPSPAPPIEEANLADVSIATSQLTHPKLPTLPSTTAPVAAPGPEVQMAPTSVSQLSAQPKPAAVMSLSDLSMPRGTIVLPPVNETTAKSQGTLASGQAEDSPPGKGNHDGKGGAGETAGNGAGAPGNSGNVADGRGPTASPGNGNIPGNKYTATKITLPRNGQFGAVVVGAALGDIFPELTRVWAGRLAYTVYLHVGLTRSWILQYSLPIADARTTGTVAKLEAPWPYNIVRPNLSSDAADSEAIMVHGYVNQSGRFEGLRVVFPPQFPQTQFVLASLQQWQFRPAARDGQIARVEVLLIIPEQLR